MKKRSFVVFVGFILIVLLVLFSGQGSCEGCDKPDCQPCYAYNSDYGVCVDTCSDMEDCVDWECRNRECTGNPATVSSECSPPGGIDLCEEIRCVNGVCGSQPVECEDDEYCDPDTGNCEAIECTAIYADCSSGEQCCGGKCIPMCEEGQYCDSDKQKCVSCLSGALGTCEFGSPCCNGECLEPGWKCCESRSAYYECPLDQLCSNDPLSTRCV